MRHSQVMDAQLDRLCPRVRQCGAPQNNGIECHFFSEDRTAKTLVQARRSG